MKFFPPANNAQKARLPKPSIELLPKDAISLSNGKPTDAFLESALDLLSSQQPVWLPSPEEIAEMHQQQAMLSMMAAIRQGEKQGIESYTAPGQANEQDNLLQAIQQVTQAVAAPASNTCER